MNKCRTIDDAVTILLDAYEKADTLQSAWEILEVLFTAYNEVAKGLSPDLHQEAKSLILEFLQESNVYEALSAGFSQVFTEGFNIDTWKKHNESHIWGEEAQEIIDRRSLVKRDFLAKKFQDPNTKLIAGRAKLYFEREVKQLLQKTFLIDRENQQLVAKHEIPCNVRRAKLDLLNKIVDYLKFLGYTDNQIGEYVLWEDGAERMSFVLNPDSNLRNIIDKELTLGRNITVKVLKDSYEKYKNGDAGAKLKVDAYNAWTLLNDFDAITSIYMPSIVSPGARKYNLLENDDYEVKIDRATNMWGNAFGDEVSNISDLISDIAKELISTCKTYNWKSDIPREDRYLAFQDFNYIVGKVKKLVKTPESKKIILDPTAPYTNNVSSDTKRVLNKIKQIKLECGYAGEALLPTFNDLLSFISENPQRHLHAVFDVLINTDAINSLASNFVDEDKNLIWTLSKELFGTWDKNSRSLYDLHKKSDGDKIFEIITLIADSMFAESFLQYYEDEDGRLRVRYLEDYAQSILRKEIMYDMRQATGLVDEDVYKKYMEKYNINIDRIKPKAIRRGLQASLLNKVSVTITSKGGEELIKITLAKNGFETINRGRNLKTSAEEVWKSEEFREFIKDTLGINFNNDIDLAAAYEETFRANGEINYLMLLNDISRICGSVIFNQTFNNVLVPSILNESKFRRNPLNIMAIRDALYAEGNKTPPNISKETGAIEVLSTSDQATYLRKLAQAKAINQNVLTSAQVKTGEGTSLASQCLSRLRNSYHYQLFTQNRRLTSASRGLTFVNDVNGFYEGLESRREMKTKTTNKTSTDFSAVESFTTSFLCDWVSAFCERDTTSPLTGGHAAFIPTVNSDKSLIDALRINMNAESQHTGKRFVDMSDAEIEQELRTEFGTLYDNIITNINKENSRFARHLGIDISGINLGDNVIAYDQILRAISDKLCDASTILNLVEEAETKKENSSGKESLFKKLIQDSRNSGMNPLQIIDYIYDKNDNSAIEERLKDYRKAIGKIRKNRIVELMGKTMTDYNRTHRREPIQMCEHIHYLFDGDGYLVGNATLQALWGRMKGTPEDITRLGLDKLYPKGRERAATIEGFFKYEKDLRMVQDLIKDGFEIYLYGNPARDQNEIKFLRDTYKDWITDSGKMALTKIFIPQHEYRVDDTFIAKDGTKYRLYDVTDNTYTWQVTNKLGDLLQALSPNQIKELAKDATWVTKLDLREAPGLWVYTNDIKLIQEFANDPEKIDLILVHPMLTKMNRMQYLATQQYTCAVGGAHYVYKGGGKNVLEEESARWLASNKRNVCYASTVHKFLNNTLNGVPRWYLMAILEDIKSDIYSIMGDLDSHKPIDGGMFVNPWFSPLENNALAGEAAGLDKKQFGTFYYEEYAAGGIVKTAGFASTNARMRRSEAWRNLTKNMTDRTWIKEFTDKQGGDIEEVLDITKDYKGNVINWIQDDAGMPTYYAREIGENKIGLFKLAKIESLGNNQYKIYEYPVRTDGQIDGEHPALKAQDKNDSKEYEPILRTTKENPDGITTINTNWQLFNQVFGGYNSLLLGPDGYLEGSEHSVHLMVYALNNIGYTRTIENNDTNFGKNKYTDKSFDKIETQDELWQPLKYSDISYAPNIGAIKSTQMNVNPKEGMYEDLYLNAMNMKMAQLGIQLDKEHHADDSEVSMPTQIIQACANKGYTIHYSSKLYKSLSTLTELAIADCMEGIMEIMPGNTNTGKLLTEVATIIVDKLIHSLDDNVAISAAMDYLIRKSKEGKKLTPEDIIGKMAWSDSSQYNKIYSDLSSHLTNSAIKMKFSGTLSVICPTERMEQMYGNKRLDAYTKFENGAYTELVALAMALDEIRNRTQEDDLMIYIGNDSKSDLDKLNAASNINTLHHYWIEWVDDEGNITKENLTINIPSKYYQLKKWLLNGRDGMTISRVYENITKGRELGAFNARFKALELYEYKHPQQFCIFDLDSIHDMFAFNDLKVNLKNAKNLMAHRVILPQLARAEEVIKKLLKKNNPEIYDKLMDTLDTNTYNTLIDAAIDANLEEVADAAFKVAKVLIYKEMEQDLFKVSKDYNGDRKLWVNGRQITVNPETIKTLAYELIMPKVYQTKFGLLEYDLVADILADKDFFTKRAISKLKLKHVADNCYDYELKQFNGKHVYIFDSSKGAPNPKIFFESKNFIPFEEKDGTWSRVELDGTPMYSLSSKDDKVMAIGNSGYEVIVTNNPQHYLLQLDYNMVSFSSRVDEEQLQHMTELLKGTTTRSGKKFLRSFTTKSGKLIPFRNLVKRNQFIENLTLTPPIDAPKEIFDLVADFTLEGKELHASFNKSLDILAGRIPAQSQLSFMPQRVVAFDNNNINTAYVSTFQLFLQGSDLDIDAVTLLGSEFDEAGRYVMWSPLADISSIERLEASQEMPFPTGKVITPTIKNNKDSFYITYDEYFNPDHGIFAVELGTEYGPKGENLGTKPLINEAGAPVLKIKDNSPETLRLLARFLEDVSLNGLNIKGKLDENNKYVSTQETLDELLLDFEVNGVQHHRTIHMLQLANINWTVKQVANIMHLIKDLVDKHNLYIKTASPRTREMMAKNLCQWNMMQICSTPSNLVELMVGVDVSTAPIKDKKTGAVAKSPWADSDKYAAFGGEYTKHQSIQEGQIGKLCVGIGAVSIKVNSTTQYYMDHVLREGSETLRKRLLFPKVDDFGRRSNEAERGYVIDGKRYKGLANLYDKSSETAELRKFNFNGEDVWIRTSQTNEEVIELLNSILSADDITPNVAMSLAAMLSVAVDRH